MTLKLVMIRCPDNVAPQRREVRGGEFSIGRGQDNEWVIPDPERLVSKRHCRLVYYAGEGEWELHDLSANGTFVNHASEPIGRGVAQKLRHGDRIKFGNYEIEVTIDEDAAAAARGGSRIGLRRDDFVIDEPAQQRSDFSPFSDARLPNSPGPSGILDPSNSPILPPDFDPLAPNPEPFPGPTQPDHVSALDSAFRPPPSSAAILPDDWDVDLPGAARPQPSRPTPEPPFDSAVRPPPSSAAIIPDD